MFLFKTMETSTVLGIAGIVVTIVVAFSIYYLQRIKRYPGLMSFTIKDLFKVIGNIPDNYKSYSLQFHNLEIKDTLLYVNMVIINEQSFDCCCSDKSNPVSIDLPEGMEWVDIRIESQSAGVNAECELSEGEKKTANLSFTMLRKREFIIIEGLMISQQPLCKERLMDEMRISHRIANVAPIKKFTIVSSNGKRVLKRRIILPAVYFGLMVLLFSMRLFLGESASPLRYVDKETGDIRSIYVNANNELVYQKSHFIWNRYSEPIKQEEFSRRFMPNIQRDYIDRYRVVLLVLIGLVIASLLLLFASDWQMYWKTRKVEKVINNDNRQ